MNADTSSKPVVLVTGASSGIGEGVARRFAAGGYQLVIVARRQEKLEKLAAELSAQTEVEIVAADVTDTDAPQRAVDAAMNRFGRLDCLINNAGAGKWAPIGQTGDEDIDELLNTSLKAPVRFSRSALAVMGPGASILNVGSVFGVVAGITGGVYCAVKAGLIGLTQALAADYGASGIRSNIVAPGVIKTDMTRDYWDAPFFRRLNHEMTPFNREGTVEDVANTLFFLASSEGSYINGQTIALDGGWTTTKYLCEEALTCERVSEK